jgi:hypothetical protein
VNWRDAAGVEHKKVLGRVWSGAGRPHEGYLERQLTHTGDPTAARFTGGAVPSQWLT